jgi:VanZ family protein
MADPLHYPLHYARLWWLLGLALAVLVVVMSLVPDPPRALPGDDNNWGGHLLAYGTMMGWCARLTPSGRARLALGVAFCLLGVAVEFAQRATGYRTFDVMDMLANAVGVFVGWLASPPRTPHGIAVLDRLLRRWLNPGSPA